MIGGLGPLSFFTFSFSDFSVVGFFSFGGKLLLTYGNAGVLNISWSFTLVGLTFAGNRGLSFFLMVVPLLTG